MELAYSWLAPGGAVVLREGGTPWAQRAVPRCTPFSVTSTIFSCLDSLQAAESTFLFQGLQPEMWLGLVWKQPCTGQPCPAAA